MTMARTFAATLLLILAAAFLGAQSSQTTGKELTIEEKFLQKSIELQVLKEQAFAPEYDSKMIALDDIAEKMSKESPGERPRTSSSSSSTSPWREPATPCARVCAWPITSPTCAWAKGRGAPRQGPHRAGEERPHHGAAERQ